MQASTPTDMSVSKYSSPAAVAALRQRRQRVCDVTGRVRDSHECWDESAEATDATTVTIACLGQWPQHYSVVQLCPPVSTTLDPPRNLCIMDPIDFLTNFMPLEKKIPGNKLSKTDFRVRHVQPTAMRREREIFEELVSQSWRLF